MRFGLFGGPSRRGGTKTDQAAYSHYADSVIEAERLGFYGAYLVEHHFSGHGQVSSSLNLLSYLAGLTSSIRLGTAVVVVPWHNPALLAEQAATVDVLSGGRLDLGLGRGYRDNEFDGFGVPREQGHERFNDTLKFLRQAWTSEERFTFEGQHWTLRDVVIEPRPIQQPHPPIWVGAASRESITQAATLGLKLFLDQVATFDEVATRVNIYRDAQAQAGLPSHTNDIALTRPLLLAADTSERETLLTAHLGTLAFLSGSTSKAANNPFYSDPDGRRARTESGAILGCADECINRLNRLRDIGVAQVLFTRTDIPALRRFAQTVMPAFQNP
jgi:alkanesulfonate monooxygenase SsuD/methylene tetrahydromethanopterin reductase-like flavin-dependent oxidoreductase (luciferase family)